MSITVRAMRAVMLALLMMFAVGATAGALSIADARPALADDDDDDGRGGDDDDDDGRGGDDDRRSGDDDDDDDDDDGRSGDDGGAVRSDDDDDGRGAAANGGAVRGDDDDDDDDGRGAAAAGDKDRVVPQGGVQTGAGGLASGTTAAWTLGGAGLLAGVGAVATWLRSRGASEDL
jgi:hypothetical protein